MQEFFANWRLLTAVLVSGLGILAVFIGTDPIGHGRNQSAVATGNSEVPVNFPGRISPLAAIESVIEKKYPEIKQISPVEYDGLRGRSHEDDLILLDVREPIEFAVSHIAGARRVDPAASLEGILATTGSVAGKSIVVYCSVGARSNKLAHQFQGRLAALGALSVTNLSGGIFRWHNEERALVDRDGPTLLVHGYDSYWGQLVRRKGLISSEPQAAGAAGRPVNAPPRPAG